MNNENNTNQNVSVPGVQGTNPNVQPSIQPSVQPNVQPSTQPSVQPSTQPSIQPVSNNTQPNVTPVNATNTVAATPAPVQVNDPGAVVNEDLKKVEINYKPPSKFKVFCLILFFILLIAFVLFLPEISLLIDKYKAGNLNQKEEKIVEGTMKCTLSDSDDRLDKNYDVEFSFSDNKLEELQFVITTRGDITSDEAILDGLNNTCKQLSENVKQVNGVSVSCNYANGKLTEKQIYKLKDVKEEELDAAFVEAGGNNPGYRYGQDMDSIEKQMNASSYTCERYK